MAQLFDLTNNDNSTRVFGTRVFERGITPQVDVEALKAKLTENQLKEFEGLVARGVFSLSHASKSTADLSVAELQSKGAGKDFDGEERTKQRKAELAAKATQNPQAVYEAVEARVAGGESRGEALGHVAKELGISKNQAERLYRAAQ